MPFDVIVVGAGINGAGLARDASMRGLRVLLLDKGDVGGGTTSWSTRLIHGGLRYLEHGELRLVRESLRERETLLRIAPHLVRALPLLIPLYPNRRRGALTVRAGMLAYDLLSLGKSLPRHRVLTPAEALRRAPGLDARGLQGAALFYDAQVEYAERLALENVLSAREHGALALTYARVERLLVEDEAVRGVEFKDMLGGGTHTARAPLVVNVAGPWVDEVLGSIGGAGEKLIGGTKGSHVVVRAFHGAPDAAVYVEAVEDGRPFFIIPWDDKFLIGTTDERYAGDLDRIEADEREIAYLLRETNRAFRSAHLGRADVLYTYAGVRPLPFVGTARDEAGITRRHFIRAAPHARGLFSVVGGKLTTYRSLAEETVEMLCKSLGRTPPPCATARTPLPGAATADFGALRDSFKAQSPLPRASGERLLKIYGVRAREVLALASNEPGLQAVVSEETGSIAAEVVHAFQDEMAETLIDCLMRRTLIGLNSRVGLDAIEGAARVARCFLGWDEERSTREVENYKRYVERFRPRFQSDKDNHRC
jgi:glycerol-3-phosphate dehydrogenase